MKIKDIMTTNVITANQDEKIDKVAMLMKQNDIGAIPIVTDGKITGIVTDRDIVLRAIATSKNTKTVTVKDVMTMNPVLGYPDMDVHEAAKLMSDKKVRRLPIVDNNRLVGIVALGDISVEPNLSDNAEKALHNISQPSNQSFVNQ